MSRGCLCNTKSVPHANSLKGRTKKGSRRCYANEEQQQRSRPRRREAGNERRKEEKTQENLKRQTGTAKWTEDERRSSRVLSEKVWREKKKKVPKIGTRSDRQKEEKEGVIVSGRHFFSRGAG